VKETLFKFSGGMKRRLCLALSMIGNPKIVFLDEPTTGLGKKIPIQFPRSTIKKRNLEFY
jgi:ABC-type multidrug transport system ATPase subunit